MVFLAVKKWLPGEIKAKMLLLFFFFLFSIERGRGEEKGREGRGEIEEREGHISCHS